MAQNPSETLARDPVASYCSHIRGRHRTPTTKHKMNASLQNLITITTELQAQGIKPTVTVLKPRRAKASELVMSMTKGVRTNTNRRGQAYNGHATTATESSVEGNRAAYFKTSG